MMLAPGKRVIGMPEVIDSRDHNLAAFRGMQSNAGAGYFMLKPNTVLHLDREAKIYINANLVLESPVTGEGRLILHGDRKLNIDGNGHSIANLVIQNAEGVELLSRLNIKNHLSVEHGNLYMNDFDIVLESAITRVSTLAGGAIAFNGSGRILGQSWQPMASHGPQYDYGQAPMYCILLLNHEIPGLKGTQILINSDQDCDSITPVPPTPPPD